MPSYYPAGLNKVTGETLSLSSTVAYLGMPQNAYQMLLYDPTVDFRLYLNPALLDARYYDASNAVGTQFESDSGTTSSLRNDLTDRSTSTGTGTAMDSSQTGDRLYLCFSDVVAGVRFISGNANSNASVITVKYPTAKNTAWTALTVTDGTISAGATFGQTGNMTWTAPTDWISTMLNFQYFPTTPSNIYKSDSPSAYGFWLEFSWSAGFDASTSITDISSINKGAAASRGYFRAGQEYSFSLNRQNIGALEAILAAGTDTLEITWLVTAQ